MEIAHLRAPAIATTLPARVGHVRAVDLTNAYGINTVAGSEDDGWVAPPPVTLSDGTLVQLYKDGEALHAAYSAIKAAKEIICLEVYIFASDPTGRAFAELLCAKAREGVRVYVIYDSFGSIDSDHGMFEHVRKSGVRIQEFHPVLPWETKFSWRPVNRDHRKLLLIDGHIAGIGGINIGGEYGGSWVIPSAKGPIDAWRDNAIGIVGPASKLFLNAFARSWHYTIRGGRIRRAEYSAKLEAGDLAVLASVATLNSPLKPNLLRLMHSARRSIYLTMAYFAPDDMLVEELCKAAKRGLRVRLMLPSKTDVPLVRLAARSFYETLMACGVEVYERQGVVLHSKTLVIDGRTTVMGSVNLDYRSIEFNNEISAILKSEAFGRQMQDLFENDVRFARKIELGEWRRRPRWDRVVQWAVSRARYLM
jgi:cardiolipin synthase